MKCLEKDFYGRETDEVSGDCGYGYCYGCKWLEGQIPKYKYDMKAKVISGFPGIGKSHLFENRTDLKILDSDSSQFSWIEKGVRHPDFPQNYIEHILENIDKVDVILVSSHKVVRDALNKNEIPFTLVFPMLRCKKEYLARYKNRGNDENFINMMDKNWDNFIKECEEQECELKIKLDNEEFLVDVIDRLFITVKLNYYDVLLLGSKLYR
jgi:hypothetical protein